MNRIEQLMVRQEWESRNDVPIFRIAALSLLAVVLACMVVVLFHLQPPAKAVLMIVSVTAAGWPLFRLGRTHARLIRRPGPGNI